MAHTSTGVGQYEASAATEGHTIVTPRLWRPNPAVRGCVYCPGRGGTYLEPYDTTYGAQARAIADAGIPVIVADYGDRKQWGSSTHTDRIGSAITFLRARTGCHPTELVLFGGSMGTLGNLNYARANQSAVKAVAVALPVGNLADIHDNNLNGFAAEIETAYTNLAGYTAALPTRNPVQYAATLNVPVKAWYSTDDPIARPAHAEAFAAAAPNCTLVSVGAQGHSVGSLDPAVYATFLKPYAMGVM